MVLSHEHEFIFISNGKTGTSSIENALAPYEDDDSFEVSVPGLYHGKHVPPSILRAMLGPETWDTYFTFCFVRNPWDWFVSQFFWNWEPNPISKRALLHSPIQTLREYREKQEDRRYLRSLNQFSKEEIYETYDLLKQYRGIYEADSLFQYYYVHGPEGEQLVDFVGRFEQIEEDFVRVMDHLGLDERLPHRNPTDHEEYQSYYTPETRGLVANLYEIDVNRFGYSF